MKRFVVVTGTDTGVGKTTVSVALLAAWARRGFTVRPFKPIETGVEDGDQSSDADRLAQAVGLTRAETSWLRFRSPIAPEAAAAAEDRKIDPQTLVDRCLTLPGERILIEGAGGLLVPIAPGFVFADLARALGARLIVVARTRLGTINHTLLTLAEARWRGIPVASVVLSRTIEAVGPEEADNERLLRAHGAGDLVGPLPFSAHQEPATLAALAEAHLPVATLFGQAFGDSSRLPPPILTVR